MAWYSPEGEEGTKILYLKESQTSTWKPTRNHLTQPPIILFQEGYRVLKALQPHNIS